MSISEEQRHYLQSVGSFAADGDGREVLVGLDPAETDEYFSVWHARDAIERKRYIELNAKHEVARQALFYLAPV